MQSRSYLTHFWRLAVVALLVLLPGCAELEDSRKSAPPWLQSQGWKIATGTASLRDAQTANDWQSLEGWRSFGYSPEPVWVRLRLRAAEDDSSKPLVVRVRPAFLDHLTLYDPAAGLELRAGDALQPSDDDLGSLDFNFQIPALAHPRDVYLRLESTSSRSVQVEVLPQQIAQRRVKVQEWMLGFMLSISIMVSVWATVQWWQTREPLMGGFALKQVVSTLWAFFFLGFARIAIGPWFAPGTLTAFASALIPLAVAAATGFTAMLLQAYQPNRFLLRACFALAGGMILMMLMQWAGLTRTSLMICSVMVPVAAVLLITTLLSALRSSARPAIPLAYMLCYLGIYGFLSALPPIVYLGWIKESPIIIMGTMSQVMFDGIMMFVILQFRSKALKQTQQEGELRLARSEEHAAAEMRQRQEQTQLFSMLAHEMKTPLATLHMSLGAEQLNRKTMERAIADMKEVIERCVHSDQLADHRLQPVWQHVDAMEMTRACIRACRSPQRIEFECRGVPTGLITDEQMLSIVLGNVLDNACKYSGSDCRVKVLLESCVTGPRAGWLWRVVNPVGPVGLPDAQKLFQKYYRSTQAGRQSGSGLGLFLVKGLLELLQGSIKYEHDSTLIHFSIWLPAEPARC